MKLLGIIGMFLLMGVASNVVADCQTEGYFTLGELSDVDNKRILAEAPDGEQWNEDHCSGGALYKIGDGSVVDPYAHRGTWSFSVPNTVIYNYTGISSPYTWTLWKNSTGGLCWANGGTIIAETTSVPGTASPCSTP